MIYIFGDDFSFGTRPDMPVKYANFVKIQSIAPDKRILFIRMLRLKLLKF